jgi:quercetin dioxygenase-like cupin family protein
MKQVTEIVKAGQGVVLDLLGPKIESLISEEEAYCVMKGTIPPGVSVPLHSHGDAESFYVLAGEGQVLVQTNGGLEWRTLRQGDFVHIPGDRKHAWRNLSQEPFEALITTTPRLGQALRDLGQPVREGEARQPAPEAIQHLKEVSARYGYWLGSPEENAEVGISLQ